jgi:hypothetical protein
VDEFKNSLSKAKSESEVDIIYNNYKNRLQSFDPQDWETMCNAKKNKIKQQKLQKADDMEILDQLAINQAIDHLISAANVLDKQNFKSVANSIDVLLRKFCHILKK